MNTIPTIAVLGSHSALEVCRGAKDEGLRTLVVAEKGREKTYSRYYKSEGAKGCVDDCIIVDKFSDILLIQVQDKLNRKHSVFIPNRSFEAYLHFDYEAIERTFKVPMFGNKYVLKIEERGREYNQYNLLQDAGIRFPKQFKSPKDIDRLCLVKVQDRERPYERAFFIVHSHAAYTEVSGELLREGKISHAALEAAVIEEYVVGAQVNFNFFYSPLTDTLELLGTDMRRQTNLDGVLRVPAAQQGQLLTSEKVTFEEAGHVAVTVIESMLEKAFELGEAFIKATRKKFPPGIIGPFALQTLVIPGPPKKDIVVIDVSPRVPGSPGITATPYSSYLYGHPVSVGRRIAMEIKNAHGLNQLQKVVT